MAYLLSDLALMPINKVYLVSYFVGDGTEMEFEKDPSCNTYFLVMNGPPPIKLTKPEIGVKVYLVPSEEDPVNFCRDMGGYCCKGKISEVDLVRK
jgi:hypothetical protein